MLTFETPPQDGGAAHSLISDNPKLSPPVNAQQMGCWFGVISLNVLMQKD